ncbi:MAG: OmpA family protein [Bacteriovoracaceae bacterium]
MLLYSFVFTACSHKAAEKHTAEKGITDEALEGAPYTALQFEKGKSKLTSESQNFLNELAKKASRPGREITGIKVLAWADKEYPAEGEKPKRKDVVLARDRGTIVKKYIQEDLHSSERIEVFNMAKKPDIVDRAIKDEEFRVKQDVARTGVSSTRLPSGETSWTKAGKVIVIVDYKEVNK